MKKLLAITLFGFFALAFSTDYEIQSGISLTATRTIDITSQVVKCKVEYELKNKGKESTNYFIHALSDDEATHLSWFSASESGKKSGAAKFLATKVAVKGAPSGFTFFKIELLHLLETGASTPIVIEYSLTSILTPHPAEISQSDNQHVVYKGFANILSVYPVERESTTIKIGVKPISYTEVSPSKYNSDKISYGPYTNQQPFVQQPITIHYENNMPFVVAASVERVIEVSHWGNIAVEEHIELVHRGAKLKGSFSRLDYQMDRRGNRQPVVKGFKTRLPRESSDIYYRDQIGNITTSSVSTNSEHLEVELRPRFPLFGGWKTNYVLGYNIPTPGFLFSNGDSNYALKIRLLDHLFDNAVVESLRVKIILPETCKNIKLVTPYPVKRLPDEIHKTYLDIAGRPVIILEKDNLVNSHIQPLVVYYKFERLYLLREPLIAIIAFFVLFVMVIISFRLDFTIVAKELGKESGHHHVKKD